MARKVANLLTTNTGRTGKGQKMFLKRQEMSSKWVTHLDPLVEASINEAKEKKQSSEDYAASTGINLNNFNFNLNSSNVQIEC